MLNTKIGFNREFNRILDQKLQYSITEFLQLEPLS